MKIEEIEFGNFKEFMKGLEYNYPVTMSPLDLKLLMRERLDYLKKEILDNLIQLSNEKKIPYLQRLAYEIETLKEYAWATQETIEKWCVKYNTPKESEGSFRSNSNPLYVILSHDPYKEKEIYEEGFNPESLAIQSDFYNYYFGLYVDLAFDFINRQLQIINEQTISSKNEKMGISDLRLKTNLTVDQVALIFKLFSQLKPELFDIKSEADLLRWISASISTKRSGEEGISTNKLRILFNKPDSNAAEFWEKHLHTMLSEIRKMK